MRKQNESAKKNQISKRLIAIIALSFIFVVSAIFLINENSQKGTSNVEKISKVEKTEKLAYDPNDTNMAYFAYSANTSYAKANDEIIIQLQGIDDKLYKSSSLTADKITVKVGGTTVTPTTKTLTTQTGTATSLKSNKYTLTLSGISGVNGALKLYIDKDTLTDDAGNLSLQTELSTPVIVDTTLPTTTMSQNGGTYTVPVGGNASISTTLTATDTGGSGLATVQYAWSTSNTTEPTTWTNYTAAGQTITYSTATGGNYYLWTKVLDSAGNRATNIKVSNVFTINYIVEYNANGGVAAPDSQIKTHGVTLTLTTAIPKKLGYTFGGWYKEAACTNKVADAGGLYTTNASVRLYAKWTINTYSLAYNLNGGSVSTANPTSYNIGTAAITLNNPTKTGYIFNGWTEKISLSTWNTGFINLTTGNIEPYSGYPNSVYSDFIYLKAGTTYTLEGTNLGGIRWRVFNTDGSYKGSESDAVTYTPTTNCYASIMLYEGPTEANRNAATITASGTPTTMTLPQGTTGNRTYTANWTAITYTVRFNANGGTGTMADKKYTYDVPATDTNAKLTTNAFTRAGYTFLGWSTSASATAATYTDGQGVSNLSSTNGAVVNLYAIWLGVTTQPTNKAVKNGETATFTVAALNGKSYQWQYSTNSGSTWANVPTSIATTSTSATLTTVATTTTMNGYQFRCVVTNNGKTTTSNSATLTVYWTHSIGTQPANVAVKNGLTASFTVGCTGGNPTTYTYQWQYRTSSSGTWANVTTTQGTGGTSATFTTVATTTAMNGYQYRCVTSNGQYTGVASNSATLTVYWTHSISTQPASVAVKTGVATSFTVGCAGGNPGTYTYQWYKNTTNSNSGGTAISGATSATYSIPAANITSANNNTYYYCVTSNGQYTVTSNAAKLTVYWTHTISTQPVAVNIKESGTATFSIACSGGNPGTYTYQWYYNTSASNSGGTAITSSTTGATCTGATSTNLNLANVQRSLNGYYIYCVTNNGQYEVKSNAVKLTVYYPFTISTQPKDYMTSSGSTATFNVGATGGNPSSYTYQWQSNQNLQTKIKTSTAAYGTDSTGDYVTKTSSEGWSAGVYLPQTNVTPGKTYTWSFEVYSPTTFNMFWDSNCYDLDGVYSGNDAAIAGTITASSGTIPANTWTKVWITCTPKSDTGNPYLNHYFCPQVSSGSLTFYYRNCQVTEDNNWTSISGATGSSYSTSDRNLINKTAIRCVVSNGQYTSITNHVMFCDNVAPTLNTSISPSDWTNGNVTVSITSDSENKYANYTPWSNNGGTVTDVSSTESGPISSAKTWKLEKTGTGNQWNGFQGNYGNAFSGNANDYIIISGYYKTSATAGYNTLTTTSLPKSGWTGYYSTTQIDKNDNLIANGQWHYFYNIFKVNEAFDNAIIGSGPAWGHSTQAGLLYLNGVNWRVVSSSNTSAQDIHVRKYASGTQSVSYFKNGGGTIISGNSFQVSENGTYTVYVEDYAGNGTVKTVTISNIDRVSPTTNGYAGTMLYTDPTFATPSYGNGKNNINVYNNTGNGLVTNVRTAMTTPTGSGYGLRITTTGTASPGWGGFYFATQTAANKTFITKIIAKIPSGYNINWASNAYGTGSTVEWLTSQAGTGDWTEYVYRVACGATGTFSSTNFFYLTGGSTPTTANPLVWDVAYATVFDTTRWGQENYITISGTDDNKIAAYGINQSATTQPTWTNVTATSKFATVLTTKYTANSTYYVWTKDAAGNTSSKAVSVAYVDRTAPEIKANDITYGDTLSIGLSDSQSKVKYWNLTTSNTTPSSGWTTLTETASTTVTKTGLNAGTYYIWAQDVAGNISSKAITVARAKTATASAANKTYNGASQTGITGNYITWTGTITATNVGNYTASATPDANHAWSDGTYAAKSVTWTMSQKSIAVSWGSTTTFTYNGSAQAPTASATSGVTGETINITRTTGTNAGSYTSTASINSVTGGQALASNYTLTGTTKAFTINRLATATASAANKTYNGASQTGVTGSYVTWTGTTTGTNAGSYTANATPTSNYAWSDGTYAAKSIPWTMSPKSIAVTWSNTSKTYTGSAQVPAASATSGITGETLNLSAVSGGQTNAGTYTASVSLSSVTGGQAKTANYTLTSTSTQYTIARAKTATASAANKTYNGASQTGVTGSYVTWTGTTTATNAGTYTAYATPDANHAWSDGTYAARTITWKMSPKSIAVSWGSTTTFTYNGSAQAPTASATSGVTGETINITRTTGTNAGSYTSTASISSVTGGQTSANNYTLTGTTKAYTINRLATALASAANKTYNGASQTGVTGSYVTWTGTTTGTNAGSYTASATPTSNYAWSDGTYAAKSVPWTMSPKSIAVAWSNTSKTYTGSAQVPTASATSGVTGETLNLSAVSGGQTNAGTYTASVSLSSVTGGQAKTTNYTLTNTSTQYTIARAKTATASAANKTYNGASQTGTTGNYITWTGTTVATNVGTYTAYATPTSNYAWSDGTYSARTITWTISAKSIAVEWGSTTTFTYNGSAQAPTASATSGVTGETINITRTTGTNVGSYTSTASISSVTGGQASANNYTLTGTTKAFTINRLATATASAANKTYTGASQTGIAESNVTWTGTTAAIDAGSYTAYATPTSNYAWSDGTYGARTIPWTMSPKSIAVSWGSTTTFTYNGSAQAPTASASSGISAETINITRTTGTNAGSYTSTASISSVTGGRAKATNYTLTGATKAFTIARANRSITMNPTATITYGTNGSLTFTYTGTDVTATVISATTSVATVSMTDGTSGGTITLKPESAGTSVVTLTVPISTNYNAATAQCTVTVNRKAGTLSLSPISSFWIKKGAVGTITYTYNGNGAITATSSNTAIATVTVNSTAKTITVTPVKDGDATITVTSAQTGQYTSATATTLARVDLTLPVWTFVSSQ